MNTGSSYELPCFVICIIFETQSVRIFLLRLFLLIIFTILLNDLYHIRDELLIIHLEFPLLNSNLAAVS